MKALLEIYFAISIESNNFITDVDCINLIYKKTVNWDEINIGKNLFSEIEDGDVYQIIQKGQDVKVMMTQEYYFHLMAKLEKADGSTRVTKYDPEQLMSDFEKKVKKYTNKLIKNRKYNF